MLRVLAATGCLAGAVALNTATEVSAGRAVRPVRVSVYRLASADGRYEASGASGWVAHVGNAVLEVPDGEMLDVASGTRIDLPPSAVTGQALSPRALQRGTVLGAARAATVLANRRLTVVPVEWTNAAWKETDRAAVDTIVTELVPWWNAMSGRQETLGVTVTSTLSVAGVNPAGSCEFQAMATAARGHVASLGLTGSTDNLMITFTGDTSVCGFAGLGEVGGPTSWTYARTGYSGVWAHELGHNLGLPHGNSCQAGVPMTYLATCTDVEYGNSADVMGASALSSFFSPAFLVDAGFLPAASRATWNGTATTFTLVRGDRPEAGTTAVEIPATSAADGDNTFWLQYNPNRIGQVGASASPVNGGVAITFEPSASFVEHNIAADGVTGAANSTAYLCDLTAPTADLAARDLTTDPRLVAGQSFTDPRDRFTVTLLEANGTTATVRVEPVAAPVVWASSTVTATADASGLTEMTVAWAPGLGTAGVHEPTGWYVDAPEDPTKVCAVAVHRLSCVLSGVDRSRTYTPRVRGTNGTTESATSVAGASSVPVGPPTFIANFVATDVGLTATVTVGDGGGTVQGTPVLEVAGLPPCALGVNATTVCTFTGLARRAAHVVTARGTNEAGTREKKFTASTLAGTPETPVLGGKMSGSDLTVAVGASTLDESNVDYYYLQCYIGSKQWSKLLPADVEHVATGSFTVPGVKGNETVCFAAVIAMGATKQYTSEFGSVKATKAGKVTPGVITLGVTAASKKKGTVTVSWKTKDSLGKNVVVAVKPSKKKCAAASRTSCTVSGLASGSLVTVKVSARGQSGSRTTWRTVIVK